MRSQPQPGSGRAKTHARDQPQENTKNSELFLFVDYGDGKIPAEVDRDLQGPSRLPGASSYLRSALQIIQPLINNTLDCRPGKLILFSICGTFSPSCGIEKHHSRVKLSLHCDPVPGDSARARGDRSATTQPLANNGQDRPSLQDRRRQAEKGWHEEFFRSRRGANLVVGGISIRRILTSVPSKG
jgi:hypothetical protein